MPIYEYECLECGLHFDKLQRFGEPGPKTCPRGHDRVRRLLSQPAIIFKGSGFYVTDNRQNGSGATSRGRAPRDTAPRDREPHDTAPRDTERRDAASRDAASGGQTEGKEAASTSASKDVEVAP